VKPIDFPEANKTFVKPASMSDEQCAPLRVLDNGEALVSCWQPDEEERMRLAGGAPVRLGILGRGQPPVYLEVGDEPAPSFDEQLASLHEERRKEGAQLGRILATVPGETPEAEQRPSYEQALSDLAVATAAFRQVVAERDHAEEELAEERDVLEVTRAKVIAAETRVAALEKALAPLAEVAKMDDQAPRDEAFIHWAGFAPLTWGDAYRAQGLLAPALAAPPPAPARWDANGSEAP
jgi:hypothetical protein